MTTSETDITAVRVCPSGSYSAAPGAMASEDCTQPAILSPFTLNVCSLSKDDSVALGSKQVTAMSPSLSRQVVYFTTATAVYRMFLVQSSVPNTVDLIAGQEGTSGNVANVLGSLARFSDLTAIGVDLDVAASSVAVVGDGNLVKLIRLYTR